MSEKRELSVKTINTLLAYLQTKPFNEVNELVRLILEEGNKVVDKS